MAETLTTVDTRAQAPAVDASSDRGRWAASGNFKRAGRQSSGFLPSEASQSVLRRQADSDLPARGGHVLSANRRIPLRNLLGNSLVTISGYLWSVVRQMRTLAARVVSYLCLRESYEDSPYYKGRYVVAANTVRNAERGSSLPYEAAEVVFRDTRYHQKIKLWLEQRQEEFKNFGVLPDGSIGEALPPKKEPQSVTLPQIQRKQKGNQ